MEEPLAQVNTRAKLTELLYGDQVNLASKLGEDIAEKGDVLLTGSAHEQVKNAGLDLRKESISISGIRIDYYRVDG